MASSSALRTSRTPIVERSRQAVAAKSAQVILKLVPDVSSGARATQKYFATFLSGVTVVGLLALLGVNTLLAQDAFKLSNLKIQAKTLADQREAVARQMDSISSPAALAHQARLLGMKPSDSPVFLNLTPKLKVDKNNG
jgi:hypothetical protein